MKKRLSEPIPLMKESIPAFIEKKERLRLDIHRCRDDAVECSFDLPGRSNLSVFGFDPASDP